MQAAEVNPASRCARLWARLSDPHTPPRRWWFPPATRRDDVLRMSEEARQAYQKVVEQAHEKFSETVRLAMLSLLGFAFFCLLITLSTPDSGLLVADPTIKMPFADVQVSFQSFLILAPSLLTVITLYLHIFYGYWLDRETDLQHLALPHESREPSLELLPTLFSLDHPVPRLLTAFIFYGLVPLVLLVMTWKAAARVEWGVPLALFTGFVTGALVFLRIRRRPAPQRQWNRPLWGVMGLIVGSIAAITVQFMAQLPRQREMVLVPQWLPRPLNIIRADLQGKWLATVNLRGASASLANLQGADLQEANLEGANLQGADLQEVNLEGANLRGADLRGANLRGANLRGANVKLLDSEIVTTLFLLRGAELPRTKLQAANLQGADLQGAHLEGATLRRADLRGANLRDASASHANLEGANLQEAMLQGANLGGADLQGADLKDANLQGANLKDADLRGAEFMGNKWRNMLKGANLQGANLEGANLRRADLRGANLRGAKLIPRSSTTIAPSADLEGADLRGADLRGASLVHPVDNAYPGAIPRGATIRGADLRGANLQEIQNLTQLRLQSAQIDEHTRLPAYLDRPRPNVAYTPRPVEPDDAALPRAGTTQTE